MPTHWGASVQIIADRMIEQNSGIEAQTCLKRIPTLQSKGLLACAISGIWFLVKCSKSDRASVLVRRSGRPRWSSERCGRHNFVAPVLANSRELCTRSGHFHVRGTLILHEEFDLVTAVAKGSVALDVGKSASDACPNLFYSICSMGRLLAACDGFRLSVSHVFRKSRR